MADDTVVDPLTKTENREDVSELVANAIIEQEQKSRTNSKSQKMSGVSLAPGAEGKFQYWDSAEFLEEKAFPHLFPTGKGGFLSTYQPQSVGFANYVKQRMLGLDSRFREDTTYMFFLYLVKEHSRSSARTPLSSESLR